MPLADAVRQNSKTLGDAQNTYKQNVVAVNTLVTSVLTSSLPTLNTPPPDWQDFVNAYVQASADALDWVNNVMARLLDVPDEVQNYNALISGLLQDARSQAAVLVNQPSNPQALAALDQDLTGLSNQLNLVVTFISGAVTNIQHFQDKLPDMAAQLQSIAVKSAQDAKADQKQIDQLLADISQLEADIKSLTAAIVALGIVDAIALTIGVVSTIALWPVGALVWFVMGPAVAVATTYLALDADELKADKRKIDGDKTQMKGLTADVATLSVLAQNYTNMATQAADIQTNLHAILAEWQSLESDVNQAIGDIRAAMADTSGSNFTAVVNDLNDAVQEWDAAYAQAGALHLDLQVNNAQLELGMSSGDVQVALGSGQTLGIIQYYNSLGS